MLRINLLLLIMTVGLVTASCKDSNKQSDADNPTKVEYEKTLGDLRDISEILINLMLSTDAGYPWPDWVLKERDTVKNRLRFPLNVTEEDVEKWKTVSSYEFINDFNIVMSEKNIFSEVNTKDRFSDLSNSYIYVGTREIIKKRDGAVFLLLSVGPDKVSDFDVKKFDPDDIYWGQGKKIEDLRYDPTNGTISKGDIFIITGDAEYKSIAQQTWKDFKSSF